MSRQQYSGSKKFKVALEAVKGKDTIASLGNQYGIAPTLISKWKKERLDRGSDVFEKGYKPGDTRLAYARDQLLKKVGELSLEVDFLNAGIYLKRAQIVRESKFTVCCSTAVSIERSWLYYTPVPYGHDE